MRFYLATSFIFPRSFRLRLFTLCFVTTHLPLIAYCGWGLASGRLELADFVLLTLATLVGTIVALFGIGALLDPIHVLARALNAQGEGDDGTEPAPPPVRDVIQSLYAGVHRAASSTEAQLQTLQVAALEDPLTGLLNRRGLVERLDGNSAGPGANATAATGGCAVLIDIDHFKAVNDTLGHDEGDRILAAMAGLLSRETRRIDIVARWGGEEFVVFLPACLEEEAARSMGRIARILRAAPIGEVAGRPITFSAGVSRCAPGEAIETVLARADVALYAAKERGRDRIVCHGVRQGDRVRA